MKSFAKASTFAKASVDRSVDRDACPYRVANPSAIVSACPHPRFGGRDFVRTIISFSGGDDSAVRLIPLR